MPDVRLWARFEVQPPEYVFKRLLFIHGFRVRQQIIAHFYLAAPFFKFAQRLPAQMPRFVPAAQLKDMDAPAKALDYPAFALMADAQRG